MFSICIQRAWLIDIKLWIDLLIWAETNGEIYIQWYISLQDILMFCSIGEVPAYLNFHFWRIAFYNTHRILSVLWIIIALDPDINVDMIFIVCFIVLCNSKSKVRVFGGCILLNVVRRPNSISWIAGIYY